MSIFRHILLTPILISIAGLFVLTPYGPARAAEVSFSSKTLSQGGVSVFRITDAAPGGWSAMFDAGEAYVTATPNGAWGIVAVDLGARPGDHSLILKNGKKVLRRTLRVRKGKFGVERLTVPEDKVELSEKDLKRVEKESAELAPVWEASSNEPLWNGRFIRPAKGRVSGAFGKRRILNGEPRNPHSGIDIAAPAGAPVRASNRGKVAFVGDFFFNGRFVVLDHGLGVFTIYTHLSKVRVHTGEMVEKGSAVGTIGSTGRATGPHLHFSVKVGRARVSPLALFKLLKDPGVYAKK